MNNIEQLLLILAIGIANGLFIRWYGKRAYESGYDRRHFEEFIEGLFGDLESYLNDESGTSDMEIPDCQCGIVRFEKEDFDHINDALKYARFDGTSTAGNFCDVCGKEFDNERGYIVHRSFHEKGIIGDDGKYTKERRKKLYGKETKVRKTRKDKKKK